MSKGFVHESTANESQEWYTPPAIFEALRLEYDMDVASPGAAKVPWIPARRHLTIVENGLLTSWQGRVWCNPPYGSDTAKWVARWAAHRNGVLLVFARTDTFWFHRHACGADCICFLRGRVKFIRGDGFIGAGCGAASMLLAAGSDCVAALKRSHLGLCMEFA